MSGAGERLLVLVTAEDEAGAETLLGSLRAWCDAGLLGPVAWVPAGDVPAISAGVPVECQAWLPPSDHGDEASAARESGARRSIPRGNPAQAGTAWRSTEFSRVLLDRGWAEVRLACLRSPADADERRRRSEREEEDAAVAALSEMLTGGPGLRSFTVGVSVHGERLDEEDFSALWDAHLMHDRHQQPAEAGANLPASGDDALSLCAVTAISVAAAWAVGGSPLDFKDPHDGGVSPVRFVHCRLKVLLVPVLGHLWFSAPPTPPWSLPDSGTAEPATAGTPIPPQFGEHLAVLCGFHCSRPSAARKPKQPGWWRMLRQVPPSPLPADTTTGTTAPDTTDTTTDTTTPDTTRTAQWARVLRTALGVEAATAADTADTEAALRRMADATGGLTEANSCGVSDLVLRGTDGADALVDWIKAAGFPAEASTVFCEKPTPEVWQTLRTTMLGLVDGGQLPEAVDPPSVYLRGERRRLVWTDPVSVSQPPETTDSEADETPDPAAFDLERAVGSEGSGTPPREWEAGERNRPPRGRGRSDGSPSLMDVMAQTLQEALNAASDGFRRSAAVSADGGQSERVRKARRSALVILTVDFMAAAVLSLLAADRWSPFLARLWERLTPWDASPLWGPMEFPAGDPIAAFAGFAVLAGLAVPTVWLACRLKRRWAALLKLEHERMNRLDGARHYAGEVLRLRCLRYQFADHRRMIETMLHHPLGRRGQASARAVTLDGLRFDPMPPACVTVAVSTLMHPAATDERGGGLEFLGLGARPGWLQDMHDEAAALWSERYTEAVAGRSPHPDEDSSEPGAPMPRASVAEAGVESLSEPDARLRRQALDDESEQMPGRLRRGTEHDAEGGRGQKMPGPRADLTDAIAGDGWALAELARRHCEQVMSEALAGRDAEDYARLLSRPMVLHGSSAAVADVAGFLGRAGEPTMHGFAWESMLAPGGNALEVKRREPGPRAHRSPLGMVLMAWTLEVSEPAPPSCLSGWERNRHANRYPQSGVISSDGLKRRPEDGSEPIEAVI